MVKIELLDYVYDSEGQNQVNFSNATSLGSWTVISSEQISISSAVGTQTISPVTPEFALNNIYKSVLTVSGMSGSGNIGYSSTSVGGTAIGWGSTHRRATDGVSQRTFAATAGGAGSEAEIYATTGMSGVVTSTLALNTGVNFKKSIIGVLDVGNSTDFPLALNFSISEARDLQARTGTYSKTFDIPATKNNNVLLKGAYEVGSIVEGNQINTRKDCRIIIDDIYSLSGKLQIQSIGTDASPQYYSCVFYGDNIDWVSAIDNKLLMDLAEKGGAAGSGWDNLKGNNSGKDLQIHEPSIVESWSVDNALTKTSVGGATTPNNKAVIYPLAGYGLYNTDGEGFNMQLYKTKFELDGLNANEIGYYGFFNDGTPYPNKVPTVDWRPAIFIYDIIHGIFKQEGFTINSNFIESDMFKKLVMLLPNFVYNNPQERSDNNSITCTYSGSTFVQYFKFITPNISWLAFRWERMPNTFNNPSSTTGIQFDSPTGGANFITTGNTSMYDNSTGTFTIPEYGFYDVEIKNFGVWIKSFCEGASFKSKSFYLEMELRLRTAGNTDWINFTHVRAFDEERWWYNCPEPDPGDNYNSWTFPPIDIKDRWFNKGDEIQICLQAKVKNGDEFALNNVGWEFDFFGGSNPDGEGASATTLNKAVINITHKGEKAEYGQTYDVKNVIDAESTQLDFLKGVIHAFNLQMTTDVSNKSVTIEPFNDFYADKNQAIDWSAKLDLSKEQEDKFLKSTTKREFVFKYKKDSADKKVEARGNQYFDGIIDNYPYREYLSDDFDMGVTNFENPFFSGTYSSGDTRTSGIDGASFSRTPTRALLWGNCEGGNEPYPWGLCRPPKGYEFRPRLLHYVKDDCCQFSSGCLDGYPVKYQVGAINFEYYNGQNHLRIIVGGDPNWPTGYKQNPYLQRGRVFSYDRTGDYRTLEDPLTYNSIALESYNCLNNLEFSADPKRGLYQNYYQGMIEMMKTNPRIKIAYFNLKMDDINSLDLRKLIYLDGYYYRINRVIDFSPNKNEVTKVELVLFDLQKVWPVDTTFNRQ